MQRRPHKRVIPDAKSLTSILLMLRRRDTIWSSVARPLLVRIAKDATRPWTLMQETVLPYNALYNDSNEYLWSTMDLLHAYKDIRVHRVPDGDFFSLHATDGQRDGSFRIHKDDAMCFADDALIVVTNFDPMSPSLKPTMNSQILWIRLPQLTVVSITRHQQVANCLRRQNFKYPMRAVHQGNLFVVPRYNNVIHRVSQQDICSFKIPHVPDNTCRKVRFKIDHCVVQNDYFVLYHETGDGFRAAIVALTGPQIAIFPSRVKDNSILAAKGKVCHLDGMTYIYDDLSCCARRKVIKGIPTYNCNQFAYNGTYLCVIDRGYNYNEVTIWQTIYDSPWPNDPGQRIFTVQIPFIPDRRCSDPPIMKITVTHGSFHLHTNRGHDFIADWPEDVPMGYVVCDPAIL